MHVHAARLRGRTNARREGALELAVVAAEHRRCADKSVVACDGARVRVGGVAALRKVHPLKVCGSWQLTRNRCGTCDAGQQTRGRGRMCVCVCVCVRGRRGEGKKGRREEKKRRREEGKKRRRETRFTIQRKWPKHRHGNTVCARVCALTLAGRWVAIKAHSLRLAVRNSAGSLPRARVPLHARPRAAVTDGNAGVALVVQQRVILICRHTRR